MERVIFRFVKPDSLIGKLITWRLNEPWSHVCVIIDNIAYSAQIPYVAMLPITSNTVNMPPRKGIDIHIDVSSEEMEKIKKWCNSKVGMEYDFLSIFGWIFGWKWLHSKRNTYCFEFCRELLEHMGWIEPTNDLVKGNRLIEDIEKMIKHSGSDIKVVHVRKCE